MKRKWSHLILLCEIVAIVTLHATKAKEQKANNISQQNINRQLSNQKGFFKINSNGLYIVTKMK
jgi:hypothetical protein